MAGRAEGRARGGALVQHPPAPPHTQQPAPAPAHQLHVDVRAGAALAVLDILVSGGVE